MRTSYGRQHQLDKTRSKIKIITLISLFLRAKKKNKNNNNNGDFNIGKMRKMLFSNGKRELIGKIKLLLALFAFLVLTLSLVECIKRTQYHEQVSISSSSN